MNRAFKLLYGMFEDPVFGFQYFNKDKRESAKKGGKTWKIMDAQMDYMYCVSCFSETIIASGRSCGKTSSVEHLLFKLALTKPKQWSGYVVRNQRHSTVLVQHLLEYFNKNDFTREFLIGYDKKDRSFRFKNGHVLEIRIVGHDKTGATTLVSGHYNYLFIDEAQLLVRAILNELLPAVMEGGKIVVTGVPNDIRDSVLYFYVSRKEAMYCRYASYESADWDEEKEARALMMYGGKNSSNWRNLVCFTPNNKVVTKYGLKSIQDIIIGDEVLTHNNRFMPVIKTFINSYDGEILNIKQAYDFNTISCTPEHPFYVNNEWISADNLKLKDRISFANINNDSSLTHIEFQNDIKGISFRNRKYEVVLCGFGNKKILKIGRYKDLDIAKLAYNIASWKHFKEKGFFNDFDNRFEITKEFMYAIGLYAAEGNTTKYHVCFSLHQKELYFKDILNKFFKTEPSISYSKVDKSMSLTYGNKNYARLFKTIIPGIAKNKYINTDILDYTKIDNTLLLEFIRGVIDGDGCERFRDDDGVHYSIGIASENLIYQLRLIFRKLNLNCSVTSISPKRSYINNRLIQSSGGKRLDIYSKWAVELYNMLHNLDNKYNVKKEHYISDFERGSSIKSIESTLYNGPVYNLEIAEDNSYVVYDSIVHNCGQWGDHATSVFRPSKLVENITKIPYFKFIKSDGNSFEELYRSLELPPITGHYAFYILGGDMGYTSNSPMHISILGVTVKDGVQHYDLIYRLEVENMASFNMAKTINYLIDYFNCKHVGFDAQSVGHQVYDNLLNKELFPSTYLRNRKYIMPIIFTKPVIMGLLETVDQTTRKESTEEVRYSMKVAGTFHMAKLLEENRFHIAEEDSIAEDYDDIITILQAETQAPCLQRLHPFVYTNTINDHAVDSLRCCALVILLVIEKGIYRGGYGEVGAKPMILKSSLFRNSYHGGRR